MRSEIPKAHPQARLRVFAIWVNEQVGDARSHSDAAGLIDPRVVHLWDAKDVSWAWVADNVQGFQGGDWDSYLLFGPEATWTSHPTPLRSSSDGPGESVIASCTQPWRRRAGPQSTAPAGRPPQADSCVQ